MQSDYFLVRGSAFHEFAVRCSILSPSSEDVPVTKRDIGHIQALGRFAWVESHLGITKWTVCALGY